MSFKTISKINQASHLSLLTKLNIAFGFVLFGYIFFYLDLYSVWWPTILILPIFFGLMLLVLWVISFLFILFNFKKLSWKAFLPVLICGLTFLATIYSFYPIRYLRIKTEFLAMNRGFQQVIAMVNHGDLQPDQFQQANLPKEYQYLSNNGKVRIYKENAVMYLSFDTNTAIVFPKANYIYCSNGLPPAVDMRLSVYKINSYWYLVSYL